MTTNSTMRLISSLQVLGAIDGSKALGHTPKAVNQLSRQAGSEAVRQCASHKEKSGLSSCGAALSK